ncbi:McrC family protein [Sphingobacterium sp. E70]|uniref:McrC family protein n=1 Tax=Sphingobacterium sp. E70 TaxID=2853439 RepID=UPI00211C5AB2|nr:McrC family protein [Sphingobacterium sp. E70]ULT26865.1 McrC family protein [Sphingobacterium sp. E70]
MPKIQRTPTTVNWRDVLIEMLRKTEQLKITEMGKAHVDKQKIHLLDIYFDWYLTEVEELLHCGLAKQYYQETKNTLALKGKLEFSGHLQRNLVHQERFYNTHQVYGLTTACIRFSGWVWRLSHVYRRKLSVRTLQKGTVALS